MLILYLESKIVFLNLNIMDFLDILINEKIQFGERVFFQLKINWLSPSPLLYLSLQPNILRVAYQVSYSNLADYSNFHILVFMPF